MFSTLREKVASLLKDKIEETEIFIPHGRPYFLQIVRKNATIISQASDDSGFFLRVSGTRKQIAKLKTIIGDR